MESQWTIPHADPQRRHIPPTGERPGPNDQQSAPMREQDTNATIPDCNCPWCSDAQRRPPIEQQHSRHFDNPVAPYANQDQSVGNRVETAMVAPDRTPEHLLTVQAVGIQDNFGYAPVHERAGPSNMGLPRAPSLGESVAEGRRRLAGRYLNNPGAYISMIRLEPSPSGQFQVIITLEMASIL